MIRFHGRTISLRRFGDGPKIHPRIGLSRSRRSLLLTPLILHPAPMDAERTLLSCPGRVQNWLDAAADQIETLLQVPMPSLSGSDQAIGALRIKRERPSRTTGPYSLRPTNLVSGASPVIYQVPPSVSSDLSPCWEKSASRCENCITEKRSRCSRDLPSCTRCYRKGLSCCYVESVPTGRRKPQGRIHARSRIRDEEPGLPLESFSVIPISEESAIPKTDGVPNTRYHRQDTDPLHAISEYGLSSLGKCQTASSVGYPMDVSFGTLPRRMSEVETTCGATRVDSQSQWSAAVANGSNASSVQGE